jgi:hypothetical protein
MLGNKNIKSTSSICATPHMDDMNANLQAANRLVNEIFDRQQLSSTETEQYDALPILRKWKPMDANEYAEGIQNNNLTPAFKLMGLSKYAATISVSPVQFGVKRKLLQPNFKRGW